MSRNLFNSVKLSKPRKNVFDLTHDVKMSLDMGLLYPAGWWECVPGDKFTIGCESLLRFSPLVAPVMHRFDVYMHYFFVPYRLLWESWEDWITNTLVAGLLPDFPKMQVDAAQWGPLHDYLGIPSPAQSTGTTTEMVSAMPFAAYQKIYNDYYRDQNLIADLKFDIELVDGDNTSNTFLTPLRRRAWEHDYFTSCLPFAQKGNAVNIPIGLEDSPININMAPTVSPIQVLTEMGGVPTDVDVDQIVSSNPSIGGSRFYADNSGTTNTGTITDLRRAFKLQEWLEKSARAGSRYSENILGFFGVKSPDARLQRPEYITGTKSPVIISEVLNTTGSFDPSTFDPSSPPQGSMAGHGVSVTSGKYGNYFCQEHGLIMGIMSVMPKTAYQQGVARKFRKGAVGNDPFDFFWPQFEHIGEQAVENSEVFAYTATGNDTFGYIPRYAEYKFENNRVAGDMRTTLDFWHDGRLFATQPLLNQQFIECDPDPRIFAVTAGGTDNLYAHVLHKVRAVRPMAKYGNPSF